MVIRNRIMPSSNMTHEEAVARARALAPAILERAAAEGRVVVSHDHATMRAYAEERLLAGLPMAGLITGASRISHRASN